MAYIEKRISFDHERDSDIINYIDSMTSHKSNQLIRNLIREHIRDSEITQLDRIEKKIDDLKKQINLMKVMSYSAPALSEEVDNDVIEKMEEALFNLGV